MKFFNRILCCLFFSTLCLPLHAQHLEEGKWNGRIILPSGEVAEIILHVEKTEDETSASIEMGNEAPTAVVLEQKDISLKLQWNPGLDINCQLYRQENGSYHGACIDEQDGRGPIIFTPPALADDPALKQIFEDWQYYWKGRL